VRTGSFRAELVYAQAVPYNVIEHLVLGAAPEFQTQLRDIWTKHNPEFVVVPDSGNHTVGVFVTRMLNRALESPAWCGLDGRAARRAPLRRTGRRILAPPDLDSCRDWIEGASSFPRGAGLARTTVQTMLEPDSPAED